MSFSVVFIIFCIQLKGKRARGDADVSTKADIKGSKAKRPKVIEVRYERQSTFQFV